jgi:hypothetical protein
MTDSKRQYRKAAVLKLAADLGAEITEDGELLRIFADAPTGKVFSASFLHCMISDWDPEWGAKKADAWTDLGDRLSYGIEDCETDDCDTCAQVPDATCR